MTPELALGLSDGRREYALGWRFGLAQGGRTTLEVRVQATRSEAVSANDPAPGSETGADAQHAIGFQATARW